MNVQNTLTGAYFTTHYSTIFFRGMPKGQDIHAKIYKTIILVGNAQWLRYTCKSIQKDYRSRECPMAKIFMQKYTKGLS